MQVECFVIINLLLYEPQGVVIVDPKNITRGYITLNFTEN